MLSYPLKRLSVYSVGVKVGSDSGEASTSGEGEGFTCCLTEGLGVGFTEALGLAAT